MLYPIQNKSFSPYRFLLISFFLFIFVVGCARTVPPPSQPGYPKPYKIGRTWYKPLPHARDFVQRGQASWYGEKFHGRKTANGEIYNMYAMTAAHKTLPLGTYVKVHNLENNRRVNVRINDRGPFVRGRIIDLSYTAAKKLGIIGPGTANVEVVALGVKTRKEKPGEKISQYTPVDYYKGNFTVQVGAFTDRNNAEKFQSRLAGHYKNTHITVFNDGYRIFYRVRVGKCSTLDQAEKYEKIMIQKGFKDAFAVAEES